MKVFNVCHQHPENANLISSSAEWSASSLSVWFVCVGKEEERTRQATGLRMGSSGGVSLFGDGSDWICDVASSKRERRMDCF